MHKIQAIREIVESVSEKLEQEKDEIEESVVQYVDNLREELNSEKQADKCDINGLKACFAAFKVNNIQ